MQEYEWSLITYHAVLIGLWLEVVLRSLNEHYDVGECTNSVLQYIKLDMIFECEIFYH